MVLLLLEFFQVNEAQASILISSEAHVLWSYLQFCTVLYTYILGLEEYFPCDVTTFTPLCLVSTMSTVVNVENNETIFRVTFVSHCCQFSMGQMWMFWRVQNTRVCQANGEECRIMWQKRGRYGKQCETNVQQKYCF